MHSPRELDLSLQHLPAPELLDGAEAAADLLAHHLVAGNRILVVGDFDADGATSTAVALRALRAMGAQDVQYLVPDRFRFGYGLTPEIVVLAQERQPHLLITVDNGVSSLAGVAAARAAGMDVLITDHHLPGAELPAATVLVNPALPGSTFPGRFLAGVGVIFYVMLALRRRLRATDWFTRQGSAEPNLAQLLDLVALGTVADVVPLDYVNRILVAQGLAVLRAGRGQPGVRALLEIAQRNPATLTTADLGFALGPRLNAAGRLEDMALGIECLLSDQAAQARDYAVQLDALNHERRELQARMQAEALGAVADLHLDEAGLPVGVCLFDAGWHEGVVGLVAGKLKEKLHRPVIACAASGDGLLKGSARSIPGLHIRDALDAIAARHPGLLSKFGGHAMAAGLSLRAEDFSAFAAAFDEEARRQLDAGDLQQVLFSDGELSAAELTLETAQLLREAGPWGQQCPEPRFDGTFDLLDERVVGEKHLKLRVAADGVTLDAIAFNALDEDWQLAPRLRLAYRLDINEYQGRRSPQLVVEYLEPA